MNPTTNVRAYAPALLVAFGCVGANTLSTVAADALFVSTFSLGALSQFLAISAVVRFVASLLYAVLQSRFVHRRGFDSLVVVGTAALLATTSFVVGGASPPLVYVVCLAQLVLPPLLPLIAFNACARGLDARSAKRVLPLIAAASTVGAIVFGGCTGFIAKSFGREAIFALGAAVAAASAVALSRLDRSAPLVSRSARLGLFEALSNTARDVKRVPAIRIVVLVGLVGACLANLCDFGLKAAVKASMSEPAVTAYLGYVTAASNAAVLLVQLGLTGRVVSGLGVRGALVVGPTLLAVVGIAAMGSPTVLMFAGARLVENVARYAINNSVADLLIVPLPSDLRTRAKIVVKGAAAPLGFIASGAVLALFGANGPSLVVVGALLAGFALLFAISVLPAQAAYAEALARALGSGRSVEDVPPQAMRVFRTELTRVLADASVRGDVRAVERTLAVMSDKYFVPDDVAVTLSSSDPRIARAGLSWLERLAEDAPTESVVKAGDTIVLDGERPSGELFRVLATVPERDRTTEAAVLSLALRTGVTLPRDRVAKAIAASSDPSPEAARLWALGVISEIGVARASANVVGVDGHVKSLRKAALRDDSPARREALWALGVLKETRAVREIQRGLATKDPRTFYEAARAGVIVDAPGIVATLIAHLVSGPFSAQAGRALLVAGPLAIRGLVEALPTSHGEGSSLPTAVASERTVSGTVRAARVLARIGPKACAHVLPLFPSLGYRARVAAAHAFGAARMPRPDEALVHGAMEIVLRSGETLAALLPRVRVEGRRLLPGEVRARLLGSIEAMLDLGSVIRDHSWLGRVRVALAIGQGAVRENALELLETVLPRDFGPRVIALVEATQRQSTSPAPTEKLDGWLEKCRLFDERSLPSADPMASVLEKVLVLRDVPLFQKLSAEELYPVAEIAEQVSFDEGETVVREGEPAEDLFVIVDGRCVVSKNGVEVASLTAGQAFGELSVLDGESRTATVATASSARMLRIPRSEFESLLEESPELVRGIIGVLLGYVRGSARKE